MLDTSGVLLQQDYLQEKRFFWTDSPSFCFFLSDSMQCDTPYSHVHREKPKTALSDYRDDVKLHDSAENCALSFGNQRRDLQERDASETPKRREALNPQISEVNCLQKPELRGKTHFLSKLNFKITEYANPCLSRSSAKALVHAQVSKIKWNRRKLKWNVVFFW